MGALDKVFGLALVFAGFGIATYWTAWIMMSLVSTLLEILTILFHTIQPIVPRKTPDAFPYCLFLDPVWIFRLPAFALIVGIIFINWFVVSTNKKIQAARAAAAAAQKKAQ